jgi:hypothetical protein
MQERRTLEKMRVLKKLWYGQYPLGTAFWGFYVVGFLGLFFIADIITLVAIGFGIGRPVFIIAMIALWTYFFIASIGVWISARTNIANPVWLNRVWGFCARGLVLIWGGGAIWRLMHGGPMVLLDLITAR